MCEGHRIVAENETYDRIRRDPGFDFARSAGRQRMSCTGPVFPALYRNDIIMVKFDTHNLRVCSYSRRRKLPRAFRRSGAF